MTVALSLFLLALALAADCFAVALSQGAIIRGRVWRRALVLALAFGVGQGLAPLIGWALGLAFLDSISAIDHWIAFGLLALIGGKMIIEGVRQDPPGEEASLKSGAAAVALLAIATSIDAAAAGFTLPALGAPIAVSVLVIGGVSFLATLAGVWIGRVGARSLGWKAEIAGGLVLIAIGVRVLIDHQAFG